LALAQICKRIWAEVFLFLLIIPLVKTNGNDFYLPAKDIINFNQCLSIEKKK